MKAIKLIILYQAMAGCFSVHGQTSLMSFNLRYDNPQDGDNQWSQRKEEIAGMMAYYHPAFIGVQEALNNQVDFLDQQLPNYAFIGVGRDDGHEKGEYTAIFYDSTAFELIAAKTYWLSETPHRVSIGWDASMERIVTYGSFRSLDNKDTLHIFNAHYDHIGKKARAGSSAVILRLMENHNLQQKKVVVMGDLNSVMHEEPVRLLETQLEDAFKSTVHPPYGPKGTYNGFDPAYIPDRRIDYIFTANLQVERYRTIDDRRLNNLWLSDHLPVLVEVKY